MLDLDKLEKQFDEILASFTSKDLQDWIDFADNRELFDRLKNGEKVNIKFEKYNAQFVGTENLEILFGNTIAGEGNYALAA